MEVEMEEIKNCKCQRKNIGINRGLPSKFFKRSNVFGDQQDFIKKTTNLKYTRLVYVEH